MFSSITTWASGRPSSTTRRTNSARPYTVRRALAWDNETSGQSVRRQHPHLLPEVSSSGQTITPSTTLVVTTPRRPAPGCVTSVELRRPYGAPYAAKRLAPDPVVGSPRTAGAPGTAGPPGRKPPGARPVVPRVAVRRGGGSAR